MKAGTVAVVDQVCVLRMDGDFERPETKRVLVRRGAEAFVRWPEEEVADVSVRDVVALNQLDTSQGVEGRETRSTGGGESCFSPMRKVERPGRVGGWRSMAGKGLQSSARGMQGTDRSKDLWEGLGEADDEFLFEFVQVTQRGGGGMEVDGDS